MNLNMLARTNQSEHLKSDYIEHIFAYIIEHPKQRHKVHNIKVNHFHWFKVIRF